MKRYSYLQTIVFAMVWCGMQDTGRANEPARRDATASIKQIRRLIHEKNKRMISLKAEFKSWHSANLGTARHEVYVVAAKAGKRYAHLWHGEYSDPDGDPRAFIQLLDGKNWNVMNTYFRDYEVSRRFALRPYTDKILFHPLFECLGWWPPDDSSPPPRKEGRRVFLDDVIDDETCRVLGQEQIDGVWCHVVEIPRLDRLWVDCDRSVVLRRVVYGGRDDQEIASFESSDFREVAPGLLLPYRIRRIQQNRNLDFITLVDHYAINEVADDQFQVKADPGTLIYDRDTDTTHQVPGGFVLMNRVVEWEKTNVSSLENPGGPARPRNVLLGLAGIATGFGLSFSQGGRRRNLIENRMVSDE